MLKVIYARPDGWHYHTTLNCPMLRGGDFQSLEYREVNEDDIEKKKLRPCPCVSNFGISGEEDA